MLIDLLLPRKCPYCMRHLKGGMTECLACRTAFPCCPRIEVTPRGNICIAPFTYEGYFAEAIKDYKFRGIAFNSKSFAQAMFAAIRRTYSKDMDIEVITSVPITRNRRRSRGFNQSELIARELARLIGAPYEELLIRASDSQYQHYLSLEDRMKHNKSYYAVPDVSRVSDRRILLVDDVMTSGATLSSCSETMLDAGAQRVFCAVAAITKKQ